MNRKRFYESKNSFLDEKTGRGKKILVLVPHEDDEINVAGNVILDFVHKGYAIYCVFSTNGDYSFLARTRIFEAVNSLRVLGVDNVFFLGYGDTPRNYEKGHIFNSEERTILSHAGYSETYGTEQYPDYAWISKRKHSAYCQTDFKNDIKNLILQIKADIIFCVDYDVHPDHRACSLLFETALGEILKEKNNTYTPIVFKGFAYCTAFSAPIDFYQLNLRSTVQPKLDDKECIVGLSCYEWEKRVRFPVLQANRSTYLHGNILYNALCKHKSQNAALRACRIINGDSVFWLRRTDSLSYHAKVLATSGNAEKINDFKLLDAIDICSKKVSFDNYLWSPDKNDPEKQITFFWENNQTIQLVKLYGNIEEANRVCKFKISFDSGYSKICGPMPLQGNEFVLFLPIQTNVHKCTIKILEGIGDTYGFSECEFYSDRTLQNNITKFIKMKINEDFAYEYLLSNRIEKCKIDIYSYPNDIPVIFSIVQGNLCTIDGQGNLKFTKSSDKEVVIRAEAACSGNIYDEIVIRRISLFTIYKIKVKQWIEKKILTMFLKKYSKYMHIKHKYLKQI